MRTTVLAAFLTALALQAAAHEHIRIPTDIPMRDAPHTLAADVYLPAEEGAWPVVLIQTPYSKETFGPLFTFDIGDDPLFQSPDFAFVVLDWRGFFGSSDAAYAGSPSHGEDGYDAVEWIAAQDWCDGNVGTWGLSALGHVQMKTAAEQPPHLRGCVPMVYHFADRYSLTYPGGVYSKNRNDFVYTNFGGYDLIRAHPTYDGFWQLAEASGDPADIDVPMLHITGWYDHETRETIDDMLAVQAHGGLNAAGKQKLLIGPWSHGGLGKLEQGELEYPVAAGETSRAAKDFFDYCLRDIENGYPDLPKVRYFRMNNDTWETYSTWPPPARGSTLYLTHDGALFPQRPAAEAGAIAFTSDPANHVPSLFGALLDSDEGVQGPGDLSPNEARDDVVVFTTPPLHAPLHIDGNPTARIVLSTNAIDLDVALRLTQVYPDGRSMLLVDGIRRASFRDGFQTRAFLEPGILYDVPVQFPPLSVTIPAGHALRLSIAGSNFDRFDKNMQDGSDFSDEEGATAAPASVEIFANAVASSQIEIPVAEPFLFAAVEAAISVQEGEEAVLAVSPAGPVDGASFAWFRIGESGERMPIEGALDLELRIESAALEDAGRYVAVMTANEEEIESPVFTVRVAQAPTAVLQTAGIALVLLAVGMRRQFP